MPAPQSGRELDRARVIRGAVELADDIGVDALSIRRLAEHLGVGPMTIYHYVDGKESIIDGMVAAVFAEITLPSPERPWQDAIRARSRSARAALRRHPWAAPLMESRRAPHPGILAHHESVLAVWLAAGFPLVLVAHAAAAMDAFVAGFALHEAALPQGQPDDELDRSFEFGLDVILDALERAASPSP